MNDPSDSSDPPEVLESQWSQEQTLALFADLARGADVKRVQVRGNRGSGMEDAAVTLPEAQQLLTDGTAKAIQIYYDFEGQSWCDTLMVLPDHVRVIRAVGSFLGGR